MELEGMNRISIQNIQLSVPASEAQIICEANNDRRSWFKNRSRQFLSIQSDEEPKKGSQRYALAHPIIKQFNLIFDKAT